ncbi:MAG: ribosome biogenesis protein [Nanoarchaeota archaeon]|nr:ribosome biogenesis protein [Nanoarchaeota archaeon]
MTLIKKCKSCNKYTLKNSCPKCSSATTNPHYIFSKIRNEPTRNFRRRAKD